MRHLFLTFAIVTIPAVAADVRSNSCTFIEKNAFDNKATCLFTDNQHKSVLITPTKKITEKMAAKWIVSASAYLHIGGEKKFESIVVLTAPSSPISVEAHASNDFHFQDFEQVILANTVVCKQAEGWSGVIGKDGKPAEHPKCMPFRK